MKLLKNNNHKNKKILIIVLIFAFIAGSFYVIDRYIFHPKAVSGPIKTSDTNIKKNKSKTSDIQNTSEKSSSNNATSSSSELTKPYGTLVSNHKPGQNGSDLNMQSQCITTPGAKCYIKFTRADVEKTLPERTTDNNGSVFWQWKIKEAGLTTGNWQVTAVANNGNKTLSTTDQIELEIK
ncbi:hypothetical protein EBZ57_02400 [bacterium]|nr:hypothetical protein [bacterium]